MNGGMTKVGGILAVQELEARAPRGGQPSEGLLFFMPGPALQAGGELGHDEAAYAGNQSIKV